MKLAENKGTGIAAMRRAMKLAGLTPPFFQSDRRTDTFVATIWLHNLLGPEETEWLQSFASLGLTDAQAQALVIARRTGEVRNSSLRDVTDSTPSRPDGCCTACGPTGCSGWRTSGAGRTTSSTRRRSSRWPRPWLQGPSRIGGGADGSGIPAADRGVPEADRGIPAPRGPDFTPELTALIAGLGQRPRTPVLRAVILRLCEDQFRKPSELAAFLKFDQDKLLERHLSPMVGEGTLVRKHPDNPRHPEQAYRTAQGALPPGSKE